MESQKSRPDTSTTTRGAGRSTSRVRFALRTGAVSMSREPRSTSTAVFGGGCATETCMAMSLSVESGRCATAYRSRLPIAPRGSSCECHGRLPRLAVATVLHLHLVARLLADGRQEQALRAAHRPPVDPGDDVAHLQAGLLRRPARGDHPQIHPG